MVCCLSNWHQPINFPQPKNSYDKDSQIAKRAINSAKKVFNFSARKKDDFIL